MEIGYATVGTGKAEPGDNQNQNDLKPGEEELKVTRLLDPQVIETGDEPGGEDGENLRPA